MPKYFSNLVSCQGNDAKAGTQNNKSYDIIKYNVHISPYRCIFLLLNLLKSFNADTDAFIQHAMNL